MFAFNILASRYIGVYLLNIGVLKFPKQLQYDKPQHIY